MATEILMPKLGLTMKTGTVVSWLKNVGDTVKKTEPVLDIETEKLSYTVESPAEGVLLKKLAEVGKKYSVASVLGYIGGSDEAIPDDTAEGRIAISESKAVPTVPSMTKPNFTHPLLADQKTTERVFISPIAKKLAAEMGIDYSKIEGTGPNGRIVRADVLGFAESGKALPIEEPQEQYTVIPYAGLRRAVGETMQHAWKSIPMVTHQVGADAGAMLDYRAMLNSGITDKGELVTIGELLLKLTAIALALTPIMNSSLREDETIMLFKHVHLGMATALDDGLVVPVIWDADRKSLLDISREAKGLAARARSGKLAPDDMHGATFTVSNLGAYGSVDYFTPIINPPQAAILGVGRVTDAVQPLGDGFKKCSMIGLSLTYDHRIIDGATAAGFIRTLIKLMQNPARSVLGSGYPHDVT
jgi:pyruvate dehydrogenase E2 component (dihydrolipoamide acetyltransferase)